MFSNALEWYSEVGLKEKSMSGCSFRKAHVACLIWLSTVSACALEPSV